jgi:predicted transcriptional regulator
VSNPLEAWAVHALRQMRKQLESDRAWGVRGAAGKKLDVEKPGPAVHLAVFVEPYLSLLLDGTKTIESRFGQRRSIPYERVAPGDVMLLKASSGPVVGISEIASAAYFDLRTEPVRTIRRRFGKQIAADAEFWEHCEGASYATLLDVRNARALPSPIACPKRDRRGWVIFDRATLQNLATTRLE